MPHASEFPAQGGSTFFGTALAIAGITGCALLILGTLIGQTVANEYDWIADTISDLAAGNAHVIMDVALYGFAFGLLAAALAAAHARRGGWDWSIGVVSLGVLGLIVTVVGARDEYGDHDAGGVAIHIYLVYALGLLFLITALSMARGAGSVVRWAMPALLGLALAWVIMAPVFLVVPTSIDGLMERVLGLIACAMVCVICYVSFGARAR